VARQRKRRIPSLSPERKNELWGIFLVALSVLLFMSLVSYHPDDLEFFSSAASPRIHNLCGVVGAVVAGFLRAGLGLTSFLLPILGGIWATRRFTGQGTPRPFVKVIGTVIFFLSLSAFLAIILDPTQAAQVYRGGVVGLLFGGKVVQYFGWWGAFVVLAAVSLASLLLVTEMAVFPVFASAGRFMKERAAGAGEWMAGGAGQFGEALGGLFGSREAPVQRRDGTARRPASKPAARSATVKGGGREKQRELESEPVSELKIVAPAEMEQAPGILKRLRRKPAAAPAAQRPAAPASGNGEGEGEEKGDSLPSAGGRFGGYELPPLDLLNPAGHGQGNAPGRGWVEENAKTLEQVLKDFGIRATVAKAELGPVITRYEVEPAPGVKIQKIAALSDDIALKLKATSVRILAPIPGKGRVGVEVPNPSSAMVSLREVLESPAFHLGNSKLTLALGKDAAGHPLVADLADMPHLLIAGATGSGKTVCVNALITSILYNATPDEVRFMMVDPKMVELAGFNDIPHLVLPVITSAKKVPQALAWVVEEMENRYKLFAKLGVRNIRAYHERAEAGTLPADQIPDTLPYLVVIIDELADLMLVAQQEVEKSIARLAHLSRAVGIHMVLATQRPSVDVLTGVIKANFPARIAFQVASRVDSRTILDAGGADKLIGKGDLLFLQPGGSKLIRAQGAFVTDPEIHRVIEFVRKQGAPQYNEEILAGIEEGKSGGGREQERDSMYGEAVQVVVETGQASVSLLQRRMRLGYGRAARILDMMEQEGIVGPSRGAKPREVFLKELPAGAPQGPGGGE